MWLLRHEPLENAVVECRWNKGCADGYGLYKADGGWTFHEGFSTRQFIEREISPEAVGERNAFLTNLRGQRLARAMKE